MLYIIYVSQFQWMISFPQNDSRHIQRAHCSPSLSIVKQPEGVVWYNPFVCHEITIKITLKSSCPFVNSSKWWFFREEPHYISLIYINLYYISMIIIYTYILYIYESMGGQPSPGFHIHHGTTEVRAACSEWLRNVLAGTHLPGRIMSMV